MEALLKSLEQLKELRIVRFVAAFFSEERLAPLLGRYRQRVDADAGALAGELLVWTAVLALLAFAVDQAFYWSAPGRVAEARESWFRFTEGAGRAWDNAKGFLAGLVSGRRGGQPRGRR